MRSPVGGPIPLTLVDGCGAVLAARGRATGPASGAFGQSLRENAPDRRRIARAPYSIPQTHLKTPLKALPAPLGGFFVVAHCTREHARVRGSWRWYWHGHVTGTATLSANNGGVFAPVQVATIATPPDDSSPRGEPGAPWHDTGRKPDFGDFLPLSRDGQTDRGRDDQTDPGVVGRHGHGDHGRQGGVDRGRHRRRGRDGQADPVDWT